MLETRKSIIIVVLIVTAFVLSSIALVYIFSGNNGQGQPIVFPSEGDLTGSTSPGSEDPSVSLTPPPTPATPLIVVEVNKDNVKEIIETLERPAGYACAVQVEHHWGKGSSSRLRRLWVRDGFTRMEIYDANQQVIQNQITGFGRAYIWSQGAQYYSGAQGDIQSDNVVGIPTYEDILEMDDSEIINARYLVLEEEGTQGNPCVYIETQKTGRQDTQFWWVSLQSGLLVRAESKRGETLLYRCTLLQYQDTPPTEDIFLLPDNKLVFDLAA